MATGEIELSVGAESLFIFLTVLAPCLPLSLSDSKPNEYRRASFELIVISDLRRPDVANVKNSREITSFVRRFMDGEGFL